MQLRQTVTLRPWWIVRLQTSVSLVRVFQLMAYFERCLPVSPPSGTSSAPRASPVSFVARSSLTGERGNRCYCDIRSHMPWYERTAYASGGFQTHCLHTNIHISRSVRYSAVGETEILTELGQWLHKPHSGDNPAWIIS